MKKYPLQNCKKSLGRYLVAILNTLNLNEFARLLSQYVCNIDVNIDVLCFVLFQSEITFRFHPIGARTVSWGVTAQAAAAAKEFTWLLWQRSLQVNDGCNKFVWLGWFLPGTVSEWKTGLLVYLLPCSLSDGTKYERPAFKKTYVSVYFFKVMVNLRQFWQQCKWLKTRNRNTRQKCWWTSISPQNGSSPYRNLMILIAAYYCILLQCRYS